MPGASPAALPRTPSPKPGPIPGSPPSGGQPRGSCLTRQGPHSGGPTDRRAAFFSAAAGRSAHFVSHGEPFDEAVQRLLEPGALALGKDLRNLRLYDVENPE